LLAGARWDENMTDLSFLSPDLARNRILDSARTAEFIGISLPHLRRQYRAGIIPPPIRIGERKYGWRVGDLIDWLESRTSGPARSTSEYEAA
jgi:prophage regulatory protein